MVPTLLTALIWKKYSVLEARPLRGAVSAVFVVPVAGGVEPGTVATLPPTQLVSEGRCCSSELTVVEEFDRVDRSR